MGSQGSQTPLSIGQMEGHPHNKPRQNWSRHPRSPHLGQALPEARASEQGLASAGSSRQPRLSASRAGHGHGLSTCLTSRRDKRFVTAPFSTKGHPLPSSTAPQSSSIPLRRCWARGDTSATRRTDSQRDDGSSRTCHSRSGAARRVAWETAALPDACSRTTAAPRQPGELGREPHDHTLWSRDQTWARMG